MRLLDLVGGLGLALALATPAAIAQPAPAAPAAATADHYSTSTTPLGTLLDDPAAKAVLAKYIPEVITNPQVDMARGMTLKDTQQYAPDMVSDDTLAKIDAELSKLPVKK
jgi:para-nitrobenzyl esterase